MFPAVLENRGVLWTQSTIRRTPMTFPFDGSWYRGEAWMEGEPDEAIVARRITPNEVGVETDGRAGTVVFNVNYDRGWELATPGTPNPIDVNGRLSVELPAGITQLTLRYRPVEFEQGVLVTLLTITFGIAFAQRGRLRRLVNPRLRRSERAPQ